MDKEVLHSLLAIKKPLEYASKNAYANLSRIKDLGTLIPSLIAPLLEKTDDKQSKLLEDLRDRFINFDQLVESEKKGRIEEALSAIAALIAGEDKMRDLSAPEFQRDQQSLETPIQFIKGVGPRISSLLAKRGVTTISDALYFFPYRYDDRRNLQKIAQLKPGALQQVAGDVLLSGEATLGRGRRKIFEAVIGDGTGTLTLKWFHYNKRYMKSLYQEGKRLVASGEVKLFGGAKEIIHPETEIIEKGEDELESFKRILPVYPLTEGLGQRVVRKIMSRVIDEYAGSVVDAIPSALKRKRSLIHLNDAIGMVHLPPEEIDIARLNEKRSEAHKSLVYDEFFFLELGIAMRSFGMDLEKGIKIKSKGKLKGELITILPFNLTKAQKRVIKEVEDDLSTSHPMHRLIQGDVGCGKTIVALIAALSSVESGYQAAIMAPTEILAEQHFINIHRFTEQLDLKVELIKGSLKSKEKHDVVERISRGHVDIVIGTHALIQEGVSFKRLGTGIIDEQHRFGVVQRAKLKAMGAENLTPNILVMTATPIPRSLAMTVYGDLELSIIDELPPGRQKIETQVFHESERKKVYQLIRESLKKGRQAYVVYPLIEESEKMELLDATGMADALAVEFVDFSVGLIHGKMKMGEKEAVMAAFKGREIDILVSTTVIEVGIDIPNASIMVIEHAERFGLSQLHQLRGRVGRGSEKSICILLAQYKKSDEARERLSVMERYTSGFDISEADLKIRGPGDFLGTRQSGMPDFRIGNILKDERILKAAREDAFGIIEKDPDLMHQENRLLKKVVQERWKGRLELAGVG